MQKDQLPYDKSFAYSYAWTSPDSDLQKALQILDIMVDESHTSDGCPLSDEEFCQVAALLASNPSCPREVLEHFAACNSKAEVLERIAGNPNVSVETLRRLAECDHAQVRSAVAENLNADTNTVRKLMQDGSTDVRFVLAENPNLPEAILSELANDENPYVAYRAQITRARVGRGPATLQQMPQQQQQSQIRRAM
jgi:hypothetical protein